MHSMTVKQLSLLVIFCVSFSISFANHVWRKAEIDSNLINGRGNGRSHPIPQVVQVKLSKTNQLKINLSKINQLSDNLLA